jgi:hypothetical protein
MKENITSDNLKNLGFEKQPDGTFAKKTESKLPKVLMGLDMGETTGVAIYFVGVKKLTLYSFTFIEFLDYFYTKVLEIKKKYNVTLVIEDVIANSPVFKAKFCYENTKNSDGTPATHNQKIGAVCKYAERVGAVKQKTKTIIELCEAHNIQVIRKRPTKGSMTKLSHEKFVQITGYKGRTNTHVRDSAMLIWNM